MKTVKLGEILNINWGNTSLTKSIYEEHGKYKVFSAKGQDGFTNFYEKSGDAIVLSAIGADCGKCFFTTGEWTAIKNTITIEPTPSVNIRYMFYILNDKRFWRRQGSSQPFISLTSAKNQEVTIPPLETQNKIACILSSLDDKIEVNNQINTTLETMVRAIYERWFIQFDFPDQNGNPYKSSGGKMVFSPELNRKIPEEWKVENFTDNTLFEAKNQKVDPFDGEKIYLTTSDIKGSEINWNSKKVTFENRESRANCQPSKNTIWFAKMKSTKKVILIGEYSDELVDGYILSTGFQGIQVRNLSFIEYVWMYINNDNFEIQKDHFCTGSTQKAITLQGLSKLSTLIPSENTINKFSNQTKHIFEKIYRNKIENQKLAEIRDWLLPLLMSGQLKVGD